MSSPFHSALHLQYYPWCFHELYYGLVTKQDPSYNHGHLLPLHCQHIHWCPQMNLFFYFPLDKTIRKASMKQMSSDFINCSVAHCTTSRTWIGCPFSFRCPSKCMLYKFIQSNLPLLCLWWQAHPRPIIAQRYAPQSDQLKSQSN